MRLTDRLMQRRLARSPREATLPVDPKRFREDLGFALTGADYSTLQKDITDYETKYGEAEGTLATAEGALADVSIDKAWDDYRAGWTPMNIIGEAGVMRTVYIPKEGLTKLNETMFNQEGMYDGRFETVDGKEVYNVYLGDKGESGRLPLNPGETGYDTYADAAGNPTQTRAESGQEELAPIEVDRADYFADQLEGSFSTVEEDVRTKFYETNEPALETQLEGQRDILAGERGLLEGSKKLREEKLDKAKSQYETDIGALSESFKGSGQRFTDLSDAPKDALAGLKERR